MLTFPPYFPSLDVFIYLFQLGNAPHVPQIAKARALSVPLFTSSPLVVATYPPKLHISRDVNHTHFDLYTLFVFHTGAREVMSGEAWFIVVLT